MIYQTFNTSTDVVAGRTQTVSSGFFNDGNSSVIQNSQNFPTSAAQTIPFGSGLYNVLSGLYYWNVYYNNQVHFSMAYGDLNNNGSSASDFNSSQIFPFDANYQSYMNLLLDPSQKAFSFLSGSFNTSTSTFSTYASTGSAIFVINFSPNLYKNQINPGQLQFSLVGNNGKVYTFIDDSIVSNINSSVYNIILGSIVNGVPTPYVSGGLVPYTSLGLFYPKNGIVILNAVAINSLLGGMSGIDSSGQRISYNPNNYINPSTNFQLYQSCLYNAFVNATGTAFAVKSELLPTTQYYVRVQNSNFNYTNNPTFVSDGTDGLVKGTIKIPALRNNPTTYITTVGLYDASNELVAVAKLSQPVPKSFDNEYLIRVNLAY
jgi:hypothetical protein